MAGMEKAIEETLARPEKVVESVSDPDAHVWFSGSGIRAITSPRPCVGERARVRGVFPSAMH